MNELYELTEDLPAWMFGTDGTELSLPVAAAWWRCDPWAIALTFQSGSHDVVWLLSRDLIYEGLTTSAGEGDVRVYPSGVWGRTVLRLSSPDGRAEISLDEEDLREFLTATFDAVPAGEELLWVPLDQELTDLLNGSAL